MKNVKKMKETFSSIRIWFVILLAITTFASIMSISCTAPEPKIIEVLKEVVVVQEVVKEVPVEVVVKVPEIIEIEKEVVVEKIVEVVEYVPVDSFTDMPEQCFIAVTSLIAPFQVPINVNETEPFFLNVISSRWEDICIKGTIRFGETYGATPLFKGQVRPDVPAQPRRDPSEHLDPKSLDGSQ